MSKAVFKDNPVLAERAFQNIRRKCLDRLKWLKTAYGVANYVTWMNDEGKTKIPIAYIGNSEYESLMPDDKRGNFMFIDLYDEQELDTSYPDDYRFKLQGAFIFWYNLTTIYKRSDVLMNEEVKQEILKVLTTSGIAGQGGHLAITGVSERAEHIYKQTSLDLVYNSFTYAADNIKNLLQQYFLFPYGALRFEFSLTVKGNDNQC